MSPPSRPISLTKREEMNWWRLRGHQEHGLHLGVQARIHARHLELVLEVRHGAQAAHDHAGADGLGEMHQQGVEGARLHLAAGLVPGRRSPPAPAPAGRRRSAAGFFPHFRDGDDQVVGQSRGAADDVHMAVGDGIEGAGIDGAAGLGIGAVLRRHCRCLPASSLRRVTETTRSPLLYLEQRHALGLAAGDADVVHRAADQLPAIGHQHDLVALGHREGRHHLAVAFGESMLAMPCPPRPAIRYS